MPRLSALLTGLTRSVSAQKRVLMLRLDSSLPIRHGIIAGAAILSCTALMICVAPTAHAMYQQSDLQGVWEANVLVSGPGAPWWDREKVTVAADGSFSSSGTESGGGGGTSSGVLSITPDGVVTISLSPIARGVLDAGRTVLVMTNTWGGGTTELSVWTKMAGTYGLSDLVGTWEVNSLASGPGSPWWERARVTVAPDGSFSGSTTGSDGGGGAVSGTLSISSGGVVTVPGAPAARGTLDAGKMVLVITDTWGDGTTELKVWTKMAAAGTYSLSDLVGTWESNSLASGPGAPWWSRGTETVAPDGSFSYAQTYSPGGGKTGNGVLSITPDGVIGADVGEPGFRMVLDAGKTVMVGTDTWSGAASEDGTTELYVFTKMSRGTVDVPPDASLALALDSLRPNPSRGGALTMSFTLPSAVQASLDLFDVAGRRIAGREVGSLGEGRHVVNLAAGRKLTSGVYLVRLTQGSLQRTTRVVVLD